MGLFRKSSRTQILYIVHEIPAYFLKSKFNGHILSNSAFRKQTERMHLAHTRKCAEAINFYENK